MVEAVGSAAADFSAHSHLPLAELELPDNSTHKLYKPVPLHHPSLASGSPVAAAQAARVSSSPSLSPPPGLSKQPYQSSQSRPSCPHLSAPPRTPGISHTRLKITILTSAMYPRAIHRRCLFSGLRAGSERTFSAVSRMTASTSSFAPFHSVLIPCSAACSSSLRSASGDRPECSACCSLSKTALSSSAERRVDTLFSA